MSTVAYSYMRFSSPKQRTGDSLRRQKETRDAFVTERKLIVDTKLKMIDEGISAHKGLHRSDKHCLGQFLKLVDSGSIKPGSYLLIENLDRLSREDVEEGLHLLLGLILKGIVVVQLSPVVTEFRKGEELSAKLMMAIMELRRGNSESEMKSVRIGGVWEKKRREARTSKKAISQCCPRWLRRSGDKYEVIPERVESVKLIFRLCVNGYGINGIIKRLLAERHKPFGRAKHWSNSYIGRILAGRAVLGEYQPFKDKKAEGDPITGYYPVVIDEQLWWRAQAGLKQRLNHAGGRSRHDVNLFAGLMVNALDGDRIEYRWFTDYKRAKKYGQAKYVNSLALVSQATLSAFPVTALEHGILSCLSEINPMDILPSHDSADDEVMSLSSQFEKCETQLQNIEDQIVAGESVQVLTKAAKRLQELKEKVGGKLSEARMKASNPQAEGWGTCHTLISALAVSEDREAARLKLQSVLRRLVEKIVCLFVKDGRRQIAVAQFHFIGTPEVRTVFVRHRGELVNMKERIPEHLSWSTMLDGMPRKVSISDPGTRDIVTAVIRTMCEETMWQKAFEPDRPTCAQRIAQRKKQYNAAIKRKSRRKPESVN